MNIDYDRFENDQAYHDELISKFWYNNNIMI